MIKFIEDKELCIKLKEKGFDEGCIMKFRGFDTEAVCQMYADLKYIKNSEIGDKTNYWLACPTYCQVVDWFRDKNNLRLVVNKNTQSNSWYCHIHKNDICTASIHDKESYYEALTESIQEALELIENK